jgi:DDE superfamily endonuclease
MPVLPSSLSAILSLLEPGFTRPGYRNFCALAHGFLGRVGEHTITGMWQAARLAGRVHHARAHAFFSRARWSPDELGLRLLDFVIERFVPVSGPLLLAVDLTVFKRSGRKVYAARWLYDGAGLAKHRALRFGNGFMVLGVLVHLPGLGERVWCLPVLARLWLPGVRPRRRRKAPEARKTQPELARELIELIAGRYPHRRIDVVGDGAFAATALRGLPAHVTLTVRVRRNAVIHARPEPRTGRGRPRKKGQRLGSVGELADTPPQRWHQVQIAGQSTITIQAIPGLWYPVWGPQPVQVILVRERENTKLAVAIISTDPTATPSQLIARYAQRWTIETCFHDAKSTCGVGQARNRTPRAVERTVPFGLLCQTIAITWYALHGNPTADVHRHRQHAPWYQTKRDPSMPDILASLRRELIKAEYRRQHPPHHKPRQKPSTPNQQTHTAA